MGIEAYAEERFEDGGIAHPVYRRGEGPAVVVMHEIPGLTPEVVGFADRVVARGFAVWMPSMFGVPGKPFSVGYDVAELARSCINREFRVFAQRGSSPITVWLRALCRAAHAAHGGRGVGALGMCLTGNFALALMVDPWVMAPVLSQPSLPFAITKDRGAGLHLSDEDLAVVRRRAIDEGVGVLGLRFSHDFMCPAARFATLREELGEGFEGIEIDSGPGNAHGIPRRAHSVLTRDLVDVEGHPTREALDRVLGFFEARLKG